MKRIERIFAVIGLLAVVVVAINAVQLPEEDEVKVDAEQIDKEEKLVNDYNVYALPIPEGLNFAGEPVPVENPDIKERMDRELLVNTYWQSNSLLLFKRANKYFPIIEPILAAEGVPDDFNTLLSLRKSVV